jgi:hypothetical protein
VERQDKTEQWDRKDITRLKVADRIKLQYAGPRGQLRLQRTQGTDRDRDRTGSRGQTGLPGAKRTYRISLTQRTDRIWQDKQDSRDKTK